MKVLANLVWLVHTGLVAFMLTAWAMPWSEVWAFVLVLVPLMEINWNSRWRCVLSILEERLRGTPVGHGANGMFIAALVAPFGWDMTERQGWWLLHGVSATVWLICGVRYFRIGF